jgi:hypothetical protein
VATWQRAEDFQAAHDAGFQALVSNPAWNEFTTTPALYTVCSSSGS